LIEESGLDTADIAGLVLCSEIDASNLRRLDVATELCGRLGLTVLSLAEPKAGLHARADRVGITIVDSAGHKTADAVLRVSIELEASSEGGCDRSIANLGGDSKLGNNLTICVH